MAGINRSGKKSPKWPDAETERLKLVYYTATASELREEFCKKHTIKAVHKKAESMGLKRGEEAISKSRKEAWSVYQKRIKEPVDTPDPFQTVVIRDAPNRDKTIVFEAIAQRTPLEQAWSQL